MKVSVGKGMGAMGGGWSERARVDGASALCWVAPLLIFSPPVLSQSLLPSPPPFLGSMAGWGVVGGRVLGGT